jgi:hypothetical protein
VQCPLWIKNIVADPTIPESGHVLSVSGCPLAPEADIDWGLTRCENLKIIPVARKGSSVAIDASFDPAQGGMVMDNPVYTLGHSDEELERLRVQSRFVEPITRQFFQEAGINTGMRVLDVGSGAGDVAFLAADLVGETGEVIGTDKAAAAPAIARQGAAAQGSHNVRFRGVILRRSHSTDLLMPSLAAMCCCFKLIQRGWCAR